MEGFAQYTTIKLMRHGTRCEGEESAGKRVMLMKTRSKKEKKEEKTCCFLLPKLQKFQVTWVTTAIVLPDTDKLTLQSQCLISLPNAAKIPQTGDKLTNAVGRRGVGEALASGGGTLHP